MFSPSCPRATKREGIALPIALAAIMTVSALIAGVFFASTQEYRVGRNTMTAHTTSHAAEVGLNAVVASWTPARTTATKVGQTVTMADTAIAGATVRRQYSRVSPSMFWVTATAEAGGSTLQGRAKKRLNALVRIDIPDMRIQGALTVRGNVTLAGTGNVNGNDVTPAGWEDCVGAGAPSSGIIVGDSATNATSSGQCAGFTCVTGTPKVADSAIYKDTLTYKDFGGFNYDSLTKLAAAAKIYTGGGTIAQREPKFIDADQTVCNTADTFNWGDTSQVNGPKGCRQYFPVVWLKGTTSSWTINNKGGQGILLVDGNLSIAGTFQWTGVIIVQGTMAFSGNQSPKIVGAVMAMNRNNGTNSVSGTPTVQFSRCAIQAVTARLSTARQTKYRGMADMSF